MQQDGDHGWCADGGLPLFTRLEPGDAVGDFVVEGFHAEGGWSDVYRARHRSEPLGPVALKVSPAGVRPPAPLERLTDIPHAVDVLGAGVDPELGLAWVAMRLVAGVPLDRLPCADRGPAGARRRLLAARIAEIAGALAEVHRRGFVHGDVKPANILVEPAAGGELAGPAVLVDFGCARSAGGASPAATIYATLPYAAPEQLLGLDVDGRADVFALGLCLHDLVAGRTPDRRGRRPAAGMEPLAEVVPDVEPDLAAIIAEATEPRREQRYAGAAELAQDLRRWLAGAPVSARPRSAAARALRCWRKRPAVFYWRTTLALLIASLAVGIAQLGSSLLRHLDHRRAAAAALAAGDLRAALRSDGELAAGWRALGLGSPLAAAAAADAGLRAVLGELQAGRSAAAIGCAAGQLGSDGIPSHGVLVSWLLGQADEPTAEGRRAVAVLAHALYDHPLRDGEHATAPRLCDELLRLVDVADDDRALHALAALGGAAEADDFERAIDTWLRCAVRHPARLEVVRLGIEVMNRISSRSGAVAPAAACEQVASAIARVGRWLAGQPELLVWRAAIEPAFDAWLITLRRLHGIAGRAPPDVRALELPWPATILQSAVAGDPGPVLALRFEAPLPADALTIGVALGLLGLDASALPRAERLGDGWRQALSAGVDRGRAVLREPDFQHAVDAGARLADGAAADAAFETLPSSRSELHDGAIGRWSFLGSALVCGGSARGLAARSVRQGVDELEPASHFLSLGAAGGSALRLEFDEPQQIRPIWRLVLSAQKGQRGALPYGGEAGLEVLLDGRLVATFRDLGATAYAFEARLDKMEIGRARRLEVRLQAESNTTVRLFAVWIE